MARQSDHYTTVSHFTLLSVWVLLFGPTVWLPLNTSCRLTRGRRGELTTDAIRAIAIILPEESCKNQLLRSHTVNEVGSVCLDGVRITWFVSYLCFHRLLPSLRPNMRRFSCHPTAIVIIYTSGLRAEAVVSRK